MKKTFTSMSRRASLCRPSYLLEGAFFVENDCQELYCLSLATFDEVIT